MKSKFFGSVATFCLCAVSIASPVLSAELLDVKPIMSGSNVVIEVTADIPMTYTYYKVPGQARAVVDIADADPEKVEPLIVVNKGSISSISVDKAMIADMTVSRLVFNLVAESEISVKPAADRKKLLVSFGSGNSAAAVEPISAPVVVAEPVVIPEPKVVLEPEKPIAVAAPVSQAAKEEEDPLGLDEPKAMEPSVPEAVRSVRMEPAVPVAVAVADAQAQAVVTGVVVGPTYIDIQTNGSIDKIKNLKLSQPARLAIDIPGVTTISKRSVAVNKFGISKVRIGTTSGTVRIVLDTTRPTFPDNSIELTESGIRINF